MNKRRLLRLADFLEEVPRKKFDVRTWFRGDHSQQVGDCGTKACAMGWATTIPSFKRAGLRMVYGAPGFGGEYGGAAAAALFDISYAEASYLFCPLPFPILATPKQVAKHIREFVKKKERTP